MLILKTLRERNPDIPVLVYSGTRDPDLIDAISSTPHTEFLSKWNTPSPRDFIDVVERLTGIKAEVIQPRAFIVHGHDETAKLDLKNFLQNTLGLPEPVILHEQPNLGRTIIEKLEDYAAHSDLAFVLLTPNDQMASEGQADDEKRRARQNVIFELGYFLGVFGRSSGRVFLLHNGPIELRTRLNSKGIAS